MHDARGSVIPDMPIENVEDGVAPPRRCQACVQNDTYAVNDKYAVQRVVDVMRVENAQVFLLVEYLG